MISKITFCPSADVKKKITAEGYGRSAAFRMACQLVGEFCTYSALLETYIPPDWINPAKSRSVWEVLNPNAHKRESEVLLDCFGKASKGECLLTLLPMGALCLRLSLFQPVQTTAIGSFEFVISADGAIACVARMEDVQVERAAA